MTEKQPTYFFLPKSSFIVLCLVFGLAVQLGIFEHARAQKLTSPFEKTALHKILQYKPTLFRLGSTAAQELTRKAEGIVWGEISQYANRGEFLSAVQQIANEQDPKRIIELISPWLQNDAKVKLTKEKLPFLWASLHRAAAAALVKLPQDEHHLERAIIHLQQALQVYTLENFTDERFFIQGELASLHHARFRLSLEKREHKLMEKLNEPVTKQASTLPAKYKEDVKEINGIKELSERIEELSEQIKESSEQFGKTMEALSIFESGSPSEYSHITALQALKDGEDLSARIQFIFESGSPSEYAHITRLQALKGGQDLSARISIIFALGLNASFLENLSFTPEGRQRLVEEAGDLFATAIWLAVKIGDYPWAIRLLEWSKARFLRQNLALDDVNLQHVSDMRQRQQLRDLQNEVSDLEVRLQQPLTKLNLPKLVTIKAELKNKRQALAKALRESRVYSTEEPKDQDLYQWLTALPPGSALIAPIFSDFGTVVLVFPAGTTKIEKSNFVLLEEFSRTNLRVLTRGEKEGKKKSDFLAYWDWANEPDATIRQQKRTAWQNQLAAAEEGRWAGYLQAYWDWASETNKDAREKKKTAWQNQLATNLNKFGVHVLNPILSSFLELGIQPGASLLWLSDDDANLLPIHTTMINGKPLLARYNIQFIPSLYSFYTARQQLGNSRNERLLAVINPTENLVFSSTEGDLISRYFPVATSLLASNGSFININEALTNSPAYLHFSTHGNYERLNPLDSGVDLAQGNRLTVGYLLSKSRMLIGTRLAVLSACETGVTSIKAPAEAMGLPTAFLQAGAGGVISTLWAVDDLSTTFLLNKFYELHRSEGLDPPKALAQAQNWLRTATYANLHNSLEQYLNKWLAAHEEQIDSPQFLRMVELQKWLRDRAKNYTNEKPYQDPYFWAGFLYSGA